MGRIIISRELSFFHSNHTVSVYADGKKVRKLDREGEMTTLPIENDSVAVQVKEWGFKSKPVMVKDGQTVLIYPPKPFVWCYIIFLIAWFVLWSWWYLTHPWPVEDWDSPWRFWYSGVAMQVLLWLPAWTIRCLPIFTTSVIGDLPNGYLPSEHEPTI